MRTRDDGTERGVVRQAGPGRESRYRDRRRGQSGEQVGALLEISEQARNREGCKPGGLGHQREGTQQDPCGHERRQHRQDEGIREGADR